MSETSASPTPPPPPTPLEHSPAPTPIRSVYGFVSYLLSSAALATYLVWLLLPQEYLEATGLSEVFPQKYWAVAIPIYLGVRGFQISFRVQCLSDSMTL